MNWRNSIKHDRKAMREFKRMMKKIKESEEANGNGQRGADISSAEEVLRKEDATGEVCGRTPVSDGDSN